MALQKEQEDSEIPGLCRFRIEGDFTIYAIESIKLGLDAEIESFEKFELNLAGVEEIDSSGIQLLLIFRSELMRLKKEFKLTSVSPVVEKLIQNYGLNERFNIGEAA